MKDAAQGVAEDLLVTCHKTWSRTWPSGPGRRAPSSPCHHHRRRRLCAASAEMGAQLGSSVAFGSGREQTLPEVPRSARLSSLYLQYIFAHKNLGRWQVRCALVVL